MYLIWVPALLPMYNVYNGFHGVWLHFRRVRVGWCSWGKEAPHQVLTTSAKKWKKLLFSKWRVCCTVASLSSVCSPEVGHLWHFETIYKLHTAWIDTTRQDLSRLRSLFPSVYPSRHWCHMICKRSQPSPFVIIAVYDKNWGLGKAWKWGYISNMT